MDPGNPGSIDEARDGDFLNSAVSINDAKRRRVESGILALSKFRFLAGSACLREYFLYAQANG
jgi:hypothetical protein